MIKGTPVHAQTHTSIHDTVNPSFFIK